MINHSELYQQFDRASHDVFGKDGRKNGSIYEFTFLAHYYAGEAQLKKEGMLELFRKTQRLADYRRAEDAVKRGWARWMELRWGIFPKDAKNRFKIDQFRLLEQLRRLDSDPARETELKRGADLCRESAARGDLDFFRTFGSALANERKSTDDEFLFVQTVLANWLTGFWWLMPLKAVANVMAEIEGKPGMEQKYYARIKQLKSRGGKGGHFSASWRGIFYSCRPPLIDCFDKGKPCFTNAGKRWLNQFPTN